MSQPTEFSYTFDASAPGKPAPDAGLFAVDSLAEQMLPDGRILARNRRNGRQTVLPVDVFDALGYCRSFRSIDGHTARLVQANPASAGRESDIHSVLKLAQASGLTISARDVCRKLTPAAATQPIEIKPVVVILTWDRPAALERLLASLLENVDAGSVDRCYVVDDSRSAGHIASNRRIMQDFTQGSEMQLHYFGALEARAFMLELIGALPQHEHAIRFLIDRERWAGQWTAGISRNFSQLLSVGKPVIVLDDDVICQLHDSPVRGAGVEFSERQREAQFYRDQAAWPEPFPGRNPVTAHMQCLGLTIPQALAALGEKQPDQHALAHASTDFAGLLNADSRVLVTQCGSLGDPGTGANQWLATLGQASRDRLLGAEGLFEHALHNRNCWLGRSRPLFEPAGNMSQITGLDNRQKLPPYFPIERGQDLVFGYSTSYIFQDSVALEYPWAAPHLPMPARSWSEKDNDFSRQLIFPGLLTQQITRQKDRCLATDPADRRAHLAMAFSDLAGSSRAVLLDQFAELWNGSAASKLQQLQASLAQSAGAPPAWRSYLQNAIRQARPMHIADFHAIKLPGDPRQPRGEALIEFWRAAWRGFGQGLLAWPEIRTAAAEINPTKLAEQK